MMALLLARIENNKKGNNMTNLLSKKALVVGSILVSSSLFIAVMLGSDKPGAVIVGNVASNNATIVSGGVAVDPMHLASARESVRQMPDKIPNVSSDLELLKIDLIEKMKLQYSVSISSIAVQASLKEFLVDLIKSYPVEGRELFESIIRGAFPSFANEILSVVQKMEIYDEWLLDNALMLSELNELEYNGTVWEKRESLFGEDAKLIWSSELTAQEDRRKALQKTVAMLDVAYETTMDERIYVLQSAFEEQYSDTAENLIYDSKGVLSQVLFGFDSVQKELSVMSPEDRQGQINDIRRRIGFDEQSIAYLESIDQKRELRWQNGYKYMDERERVIASLEGDEQAQALADLQLKYFEQEAPTIAREEQDEFFRFKRPRFYGRN